jgi:hypothetical protein
VNWIYLAQNMDHWRAVVNTLTVGFIKTGNFLTSSDFPVFKDCSMQFVLGFLCFKMQLSPASSFAVTPSAC